MSKVQPQSRPLLGIMSCNRDIGGRTAQVVANRYVDPVLERVDAAGLIIPAATDPGAITQIAGLFDGLLLTGSASNILPTRYRSSVSSETGPFDQGRDRVVFGMIDAMLARGKPILGICRGLQEINVFFGGSLRCDAAKASDLIGHHSEGHDNSDFAALFDHQHAVDIQPGGVLEPLLPSRRIVVNSVHQQAIRQLGDGLRIEAIAPDGLIEAVSTQVGGASVLGVQWHPEWDLATNPESQAIFDHFGGLLRGAGREAHLTHGAAYEGRAVGYRAG